MSVNIASNESLTRLAAATEAIAQHLVEQSGGATSWAEVQNLIRHGLGPQSFPVGSQLQVEHSTYGLLTFDVIGHNIDTDPRGLLPYSMTMQLHDCVENTAVDSGEALYSAVDGLAAGTYHFTIQDGYDVAFGGGKTYQFTLAKPVPAGGVLCFPWGYEKQASATKVSSYATVSAAEVIESVSVTEGSGGLGLGTTDGTVEHLNHITRVRYGSNRYSKSAIRQWLNSTSSAGGWWKPQTEFDRPASYANRAGFLAGFPEDFRAALGAADHIVALNTVTDGAGSPGGSSSETVRDKVFLVSRAEIGLGAENGVAEGKVYPYWANATAADRIKLLNGAARYWWLRTPNTGDAVIVRNVYPDGSLYSNYAYNTYGVAAACTIY